MENCDFQGFYSVYLAWDQGVKGRKGQGHRVNVKGNVKAQNWFSRTLLLILVYLAYDEGL